MTTYGPFYPTVVATSPGGAAWQNPNNVKQADGNLSTSTITGEGGTDLLKLTGFNASVPGSAILKRVRFVPTPPIPGSFNPDVFQQVGVFGGPHEASNRGDHFAVDDDMDGFPSLAQLADPAYGFQLSVYASHGGTVSLDAIALFVDAD